jgi:hypothetical protein
MVYLRWPSNAASTIGILVAVSLFISGVMRVTLSLAFRNAMAAGPEEKIETIHLQRNIGCTIERPSLEL